MWKGGVEDGGVGSGFGGGPWPEQIPVLPWDPGYGIRTPSTRSTETSQWLLAFGVKLGGRTPWSGCECFSDEACVEGSSRRCLKGRRKRSSPPTAARTTHNT